LIKKVIKMNHYLTFNLKKVNIKIYDIKINKINKINNKKNKIMNKNKLMKINKIYKNKKT